MIIKILFFLFVYGEGIPWAWRGGWESQSNRLDRQGKRLENSGIVRSRLPGNVRLYPCNPRFPFLKELKELVAKAYDSSLKRKRTCTTGIRKRPRRTEFSIKIKWKSIGIKELAAIVSDKLSENRNRRNSGGRSMCFDLYKEQISILCPPPP